MKNIESISYQYFSIQFNHTMSYISELIINTVESISIQFIILIRLDLKAIVII